MAVVGRKRTLPALDAHRPDQKREGHWSMEAIYAPVFCIWLLGGSLMLDSAPYRGQLIRRICQPLKQKPLDEFEH
jgi:hypothetical protein